MPLSKTSKRKKLLIITSSGGGGLLQAAIAKEQEERAKDPDLIIVKRDVLKDWIWKLLGKFCIAYWNGAQRKGFIGAQVFVIRLQWVFDFFSWPNVFYKMLLTLLDENVDRVIDTQNMGTSAILKAIRVFNRKKRKNIVLEKIVVDLPTKEAIHYFRSIKGLSKKDKKILKLASIPPLLEKGQTAEDFWQENCGLSEADVKYEDLNVRESFRKLKGKPRSASPLMIPLQFKNKEELLLMRKCLDKGLIRYKVRDNEVHLAILPEDRLFTILLGSQPASESTFMYVKKFLSVAKEAQSLKIPTHLFVFCADHQPEELSLFRRVADLVNRTRQYPKYFSIIPFSFQNDNVIAPLFHRSDLTCTRSGGQTAMELMTVASGEMWIHSEAKKESARISSDELLEGIPGWEGASALYLQKTRGAKILTPYIFVPHARRLFRSTGVQSAPNRVLESTA